MQYFSHIEWVVRIIWVELKTIYIARTFQKLFQLNCVKNNFLCENANLLLHVNQRKKYIENPRTPALNHCCCRRRRPRPTRPPKPAGGGPAKSKDATTTTTTTTVVPPSKSKPGKWQTSYLYLYFEVHAVLIGVLFSIPEEFYVYLKLKL